MNLFEQSFKLLHKNIKIGLIFLITSMLSFIIMFIDKNVMITAILLFIYAVVSLVGTMVAIGWSNEAVTSEKIVEKPGHYLRYLGKFLGVMGTEILILILVNTGFAYKVIKGIPEHVYWSNAQIVGEWAIQNSQLFLFILLVNLIVLVGLSFAHYIVIIDGKGVFQAIKKSLFFSFKGIQVGFLSGLAIVSIGIALLVVLDFLFKPGTLSGQIGHVLLMAYGEAVFTVFMVGLYHKINKSV